jgi:hypothetical protein
MVVFRGGNAMLSREELARLRQWSCASRLERGSWLEEVSVGSLLDHIEELEAILHDLRLDSAAYQRGWREGCQACSSVVGKASGYPYGPGNPPPTGEQAVYLFGLALGQISKLGKEGPS